MFSRILVVAILLVLSLGRAASSNAESYHRRDLLDLERLLRFVLELYPTIEPNVRIRSVLGYVDEQKFSPYVVDMTLFYGANAGMSPERIVFEGAASFDAAGFLDIYSGSTTAEKERFASLQRSLGLAPLNTERLRGALAAVGAPFAARAPSTKTCRSLVMAFVAIGEVTQVDEPQMEPLPSERSARDLNRTDVVWRIDVVAKRPSGLHRLRIQVGPWGDLLVIGPLGQSPR